MIETAIQNLADAINRQSDILEKLGTPGNVIPLKPAATSAEGEITLPESIPAKGNGGRPKKDAPAPAAEPEKEPEANPTGDTREEHPEFEDPAETQGAAPEPTVAEMKALIAETMKAKAEAAGDGRPDLLKRWGKIREDHGLATGAKFSDDETPENRKLVASCLAKAQAL